MHNFKRVSVFDTVRARTYKVPGGGGRRKKIPIARRFFPLVSLLLAFNGLAAQSQARFSKVGESGVLSGIENCKCTATRRNNVVVVTGVGVRRGRD